MSPTKYQGNFIEEMFERIKDNLKTVTDRSFVEIPDKLTEILALRKKTQTPEEVWKVLQIRFVIPFSVVRDEIEGTSYISPIDCSVNLKLGLGSSLF